MYIETNEYKFRLISSSWSGPVVIYISNDKFGDSAVNIKEKAEISAGLKFTFCELVVSDWDKYLTPWEADIGVNGRAFEGKARELLQSIGECIVPKIKEMLPDSEIYICGYSLAGLFSLWSLYESNLFDGAACCSGSLWYPGWKEYVSEKSLQKGHKVYLSLGKKEKNTKNPVMKTVEDNMLFQYELLKENHSVHFDWNEGGHFSNTEDRMAMGVNWLIN